MQLPRGKFRSVIKGVALNSLIQELAEVRYTGVVTITRNHELISLVIQKGRYLLAEYGSMKGDPAWEAVNALGEANVDAILADFSDAGLKLATEFNEACLLSSPIITRAFKAPRERWKEPVAPERPARAAPAVPAAVSPMASGALAVPQEAPVPLRAPLPRNGETPATTGEAPGDDETSPGGGYDELALLHMEISALDDVDVEHIATKVRKNAKGIVRKLHLGHIMTEKEDEKGT